MSKNETTSKRIASIAARGMKNPASLTLDEIKRVCGSANTQAPDKTTMCYETADLRELVIELLATVDIPEEWRQRLEKAVGHNVVPAPPSAEGGDDLGLPDEER
jgi:hypothetical protein